MYDRKKIISTLEEIKTQTAEIGLDSAVIAHEFIDKIIAMLKEQEAVVWCKDCKHQREYKMGSCPYYTTYGLVPPDGWFCAGGRRKEGR